MEETSQRILDAAGEIFAERGFRAATIREICERAGANIAAVNYHFRDKETLYGEVIYYAARRVFEKYPLDPEPGDDSPEQRLRTLVRKYLMRFFDPSLAWYGKLILRELVEPTASFEKMIEADIRDYARQLTETVRDIVGEGLTDEQVRMCSKSVAGQCLLYPYAELLLVRLYPEDVITPEFIDRLVDHITNFSIAGLKSVSHDGAVEGTNGARAEEIRSNKS